MTSLARSWNRFWFEAAPTSTLAVVRIVFGLVSLGWAASLAPDCLRFFSRSGIVPTPDKSRWAVGIFDVARSDVAVVAVLAVLAVASIGLVVGYHSRVCALLVFVAMLSFERRNPFILNSGDSLLRNIALYLTLAPVGASLSIDHWRRHRDRFWVFPARPVWPLRLLQIQLSVIYLTTVWDKVRGTKWNDGTAVSYALRLSDLARFHTPSAVTHSLLLVNVLTFGTLALELSLGVLVWVRRARPAVLLAGVAMHLAIDVSLMVGFFSVAMFVLYVAFVPPETMATFLERAAARIRHTRIPLARRLPAVDEPPVITDLADDRRPDTTVPVSRVAGRAT